MQEQTISVASAATMKKEKTEVSLFSFGINLGLTMVILAVILMPVYPALARTKLKKKPDLTIPYTKESHLLVAKYPNSTFLQGVITVILCTIVCTPFGTGLAGCIGLTMITPLQGAILKGITCGICSAMAYYLSVIFVFFKKQQN